MRLQLNPITQVKDAPVPYDTSFHTQGPLPPDADHLYVPRVCDDALARLITQRHYVALIGPRLSGKSSMLLRQWSHLRQSQLHIPVYISLTQLHTLPEPSWYGQLHHQIAHQTDGLLNPPADPASHPLALQEEIVTALENSLRGKVLVILLDHIEATPSEFSTAFFATLREMFVNRWMRPALHNVVFVLAGRFMPDELIKDPAISPFRVTETVYVHDATLEAITFLVAALATPQRQIATDVPARVFEWTEGDVYLTHKLCAGIARDISKGGILLSDVDRAVRRYLYEDDMFRTVWKHIQQDPEITALIDTLLQHRDPVRFTLLQRSIMQAWLEGAVKADSFDNCALRSLVHESVFFSLQRSQPPPRPSVPGPPKAARLHAIDLSDGQTVLRERFRLEHVLHPGMTSYVFRGTDLQTGERVAIKQLMVSRESNEMAWHRFQRESDALRRLNHPNIVRMIDTFREGDHEYIVMEYIYGGSLFERLNREGRLPLHTALDIAMRLADALHHAHAQGIIHRDVKPSNIMLTPDYSPRLADFGVARLNFHSRVTLPNTVIGTTPYLSPEGCMGDTLDPRGDIWSLGIMLFEMLTGTLPFVGRTDDVIIRAILDNPLPNIRTIRPDVPDSVVSVLDKMLVKSSAQRIQSAGAARDELRAVLCLLHPGPET